MPDLKDSPLDRGDFTRPIGPEELESFDAGGPTERGGGRGPVVAAAVALVVLVAVAVWFGYRRGARSSPPDLGAQPAAPATAAQAPAPAAPERLPLPALEASDPLVRELLAQLSAHPQLARWLVPDGLIRRFVATVVNLAEGTSPATHLRFLTPEGGFRARASGERWYADPASFRRYDLVTEVFYSLDARRSAELYRTLHPLFDAAYAEIGSPASSFDATLAFAIGNLLAVPIPEPPIELVPQGVSFAFADRRLEQLTAADKHLLRLGPANARRVQEKLRELAAALDLRPL